MVTTAAFRPLMPPPAARHAEFRAIETVAAESLEQHLGFAAEMRLHPHAAPFERPVQVLGKRGTQQHIHAQPGHAPRQFLRRERKKDDFFPRHFLSVPAGDEQQARRRIEQRRNAFLRNGHGNRHAGSFAIGVPRK